ncbi:MAG TPA: SRPBCC family protein [Vineibacter sp.]|nr:SRPBCC family protein [Vineibacter sp.]
MIIKTPYGTPVLAQRSDLIGAMEAPMPMISETARLGTSAHNAWRDIGSFGAVGHWHPMLAEVEAQGDRPGARRRVITTQGARQVERLSAFDPEGFRYTYTIEKSALPVSNYRAELRVDEAGRDRSRLTWSAAFDATANAPETTEAVRQFLRAGLDNLTARYP